MTSKKTTTQSVKRKNKLSAKEHNAQINPDYKPMTMLKEFLQLEAAGGVILIICAAIAMIIANSPLEHIYHQVLHETKAVVGVGGLVLEKDLIHWINDGLMAIFFFLVGLEIKREILEGALSSRQKLTLPVVAALGGMIVPGLVFYFLNQSVAETISGWAIPTATDIAFAVGVIALLGNRVPVALKVFLLALAIIDDLGAIVIIALFYTSGLDVMNLGLGAFFIAALFTLNYMGVSKGSIYLVFGLALWVCVLKSGVHATLAGVITAFAIPLNVEGERRSLLRQLEHDLHSFVAFIVLPLFALANAGVSLKGVSMNAAFENVTIGVILGLVFGKQIGITGFTWLSIKLGFAKLPDGIEMKHIWAVSILGGIGFTMSIFIATLGYFGPEHALYLTQAKLGIIAGSVISALAGVLALHIMFPNASVERFDEESLLSSEPSKEKPVAKKTAAKKKTPAKKKSPAKNPVKKKA